MVKEIFYKTFLSIKKMKPNIKFIIAGDWNQLPPVKDRGSFDYKSSFALHELCDGNQLQLTECRRSDKKLYNMSMVILNDGNVTKDVVKKCGKQQCKISICFTNNKRKIINHKQMLVSSKGKRTTFLKGLAYDKNSQDMWVYEGLPIIARKNNQKLDVYNNETFTVTKLNKNTIEIENDFDDKIEIPINQFIHLFNPAYCITVHRSQGCSINHPYTIYEWNLFSKNMQYVAITRATKAKYLNIA
jgi:ATP-dependent exoDNAse (exonuclease V) alpha subunit